MKTTRRATSKRPRSDQSESASGLLPFAAREPVLTCVALHTVALVSSRLFARTPRPVDIAAKNREDAQSMMLLLFKGLESELKGIVDSGHKMAPFYCLEMVSWISNLNALARAVSSGRS